MAVKPYPNQNMKVHDAIPQLDANTLLRKPEVCRMLSISIETLKLWRKSGKFPQPIKFSTHLVAWKYSTVVEWIDSHPLSSDGSDIEEEQ
jgi:predicted DNA-binding transcriptional regulator AlpA